MGKKIENIPTHVAIIPDGNRRWARQKGVPSWQGHEEGAKNLENVLRENLDLGVKYVTFWGSSLDNLKKRPLSEKRALLKIYRRYFQKLIESQDIHGNEVQVNVIGRWEEQFPETLKKIIRKCMVRTKRYHKYFLNFLLAYSGDDEIVTAINKLMAKCKGKARVSAEMLKNQLMTNQLPPVDLLVRTGGEPHMSAGFMMWDIANSQMYFSETLWPDFNAEKMREAIEDYSKRARRFGG